MSNYKWFRRLKGGRWEQWWTTQPKPSKNWYHINSEVQNSRCYISFGHPQPHCKGAPQGIEEYE